MKIIDEPYFEILGKINGEEILKHLEFTARTAYQSQNKITANSAAQFIKKIIKKKHLSVLEHCNISIKIICGRDTSHQLVRHRICSFTQESQRYCRYNELQVIKPNGIDNNEEYYLCWKKTIEDIEKTYKKLLKNGIAPQSARSILPNCTKTEIAMTANLREWRLIFKTRCQGDADPQIRKLMLKLLEALNNKVPIIFEDIYKDKYYLRYIVK
jgi:thymidylate synthase (FAD)